MFVYIINIYTIYTFKMNINNECSAFWDCLIHERNVQCCHDLDRHLACFEWNNEALKHSLYTLSSSLGFGTEPLSVSAFSFVPLFLRQWLNGKVFTLCLISSAQLLDFWCVQFCSWWPLCPWGIKYSVFSDIFSTDALFLVFVSIESL